MKGHHLRPTMKRNFHLATTNPSCPFACFEEEYYEVSQLVSKSRGSRKSRLVDQNIQREREKNSEDSPAILIPYLYSSARHSQSLSNLCAFPLIRFLVEAIFFFENREFGWRSSSTAFRNKGVLCSS